MPTLSPTIAVGIPCDSTHIKFLQDAVDSINQEFMPPAKILISISNVDRHVKLVSDIPYTIYYNKEKLYAGQNRNIIMKNNTHEYVTFHDADDLSHRSRILSISEQLKKDTNISFLVHGFTWDRDTTIENFNKIDNNNVNALPFNYTLGDLGDIPYANGPVTIRKDVVDKIGACSRRCPGNGGKGWCNLKVGEDRHFIENCLDRGLKGVYITNSLYYYRNQLSCWS